MIRVPFSSHHCPRRINVAGKTRTQEPALCSTSPISGPSTRSTGLLRCVLKPTHPVADASPDADEASRSHL